MRKFPAMLIALFMLGLTVMTHLQSSAAFAATISNLDNDATQWSIFHDQGYTSGDIKQAASPSLDKAALKVSLLPGNAYAGIHAYRDLPAANDATNFDMDISFFYTKDKPVQALEFTMNKWTNNVRWEWAMQWQIIQDGSAQQGKAMSWRVWDGSNWINTGVAQPLAINQWHALHLKGNIVNGQVHYISFLSDGMTIDMNQYTYAPVASPGEKLAVGLQLNSNYMTNPYPVYFDRVNLVWS